ncbi:MAG: MauE/DoxX family redox-associated membrane protein [Xanthomarina gelatinilytica]|uniref:MauE/DoxX family redox-associated membrane protein n=1 Tax=Xanthomarina gelatinilytica TaxID=1137281 RepID=UPI003A87BB94
MGFQLTSLKKILLEVLVLLFILLFVYASISKLLEFNDFQTQLGQSPLLGAFAIPISYAVIGIELVTSLLLAFIKTRKWGLYLFFLLMVMFTTYIIIILNYTSFTPCSCGGVLESLGWTEHLIFNIICILLAIGAIYFIHVKFSKQKLMGLLSLSALGIILVIGLFLSSEKKIKRNNSFLRTYMPHPIKQISMMDLKYNSYYIAGIHKDKIYLGNTTAPLNLTIIDTSLKTIDKLRVSIDQMDLPYKHIRITVTPPYFYVVDGNVPIIFRGSTNSWKAYTLLQDAAYFSQFVVTDTSHFVIRTMNSNTQENILGILKTGNNKALTLFEKYLEKQVDGVFDTDGLLLWNPDNHKIIYVYYYRNQYLISNEDLNNKEQGKTIDTVSKAQIDFTYYPSKGKKKLDWSSLKINNYSTTSGNYLYVHSKRLGKHEPEKMLKKASIIDVYDFKNNTYEFSFYLLHHKGNKMKSFQVDRYLLVAIMDDKLVTYQLNNRYFEINDLK